MASLAAVPVSPSGPAIEGIVALLDKFLPRLVDTGIVRREQKGVESGGCRTPQVLIHEFKPLIGDFGALRIDGDEIDTGSRMRDVEELGVKAGEFGAVVNLFKLLYHAWPRRGADIFEDHDRRSVGFNPSQHTAEGLSRLSLGIDSLLYVVQVGVVDTRCASDQKVDVPWNGR